MKQSLLGLILISTVGCGDGDSSSANQTPPMGRVAIEAWLTDASTNYKTWAAEPAVHASREPSPHGFNRIYSNDIIAANATTTGPWPKGAAAVKELYASATAMTPIGIAVYLKLEDDSAAGANWYWYERVPVGNEAPHDANGVVADGRGDSGPPKAICVGCHAGAGTDPMHTPTPGGRDQVYTPVR